LTDRKVAENADHVAALRCVSRPTSSRHFSPAHLDKYDERFDNIDAELSSTRAELKGFRIELNNLRNKVENISGYRKKIDHALERIAAIEKHLGIDTKMRA
jgi:archaellum component FlaC